MITKPEISVESGTFLPVMETFYSIQGEGCHAGAPAFFIRLGGCDVGCHWCDERESWAAENHPLQSIEEIVTEVKKNSPKTIIITGGEPLLYDLTNLTQALKYTGGKPAQLHLETSGAYPLSGMWDWICLSPKKFKNPLPGIICKANELKVIVYNQDDFRFAEEQTANCKLQTTNLYLQPEWSRREEMLPLIVHYVKQNPKWKISLQMHKYMGRP